MNENRDIDRLHRLTVIGRWLFVLLLWSTIGAWSLWSLREDIVRLLDYFTWVSVFYSFVYNRLAAMGLGLCVGMTLATMIWQSRNILWGLPAEERSQLERLADRIRARGPKHPLWRFLEGDRRARK